MGVRTCDDGLINRRIHVQARPECRAFLFWDAAAVGVTTQAINQHLARAKALEDDLDRIIATKLANLPDSQNRLTSVVTSLEKEKTALRFK